MKPMFYMDIDSRMASDLTMHDVMSYIVQKLHHATKLGKVALGFPGLNGLRDKTGLGNRVRVFAEDAETLTKVADFLAGDWRMDEYAIVRHPKPVLAGIERYEAFYRFRMSHPISKSRMEKLEARGVAEEFASFNAESRARQQAMLNGTKQKIGFATIYSATTRRQFKLHIERRSCTASCGEPDGYGLSRKTSVVALPVIE